MIIENIGVNNTYITIIDCGFLGLGSRNEQHEDPMWGYELAHDIHMWDDVDPELRLLVQIRGMMFILGQLLILSPTCWVRYRLLNLK